jgi:NAD(P)-dependent dehydrogenase (short-subunit alcohol dehydrogenase family)
MDRNRVVVVTGGASGMGLGISRRFAADGHPVAMLDVQEEALEREAQAIQASGGTVLARRVDVTSRAEIDDAYAAVRAEFGPIAIVIANAGISNGVPFLDIDAESWRRMIDVNLTGVFHTIQAATRDMVEARWGRIVTISSNAAQQGAPDRAHYSAAKGGVIGITKALARELAPHGITVNTIPPALVDTPLARAGVAAGEVPPIETVAGFIPLKRAGTAEDIASACAFLCSDEASYITGIELNVNGGLYI